MRDDNYETKNKFENKVMVEIKENKLLCSFFDNEIPKAMNFNSDESILLTITENGLFTAYNFSTLQLIKQINFDQYTLDMLVLNKLIIIAFKSSLLVLSNDQIYEPIKNFEMEFLVAI